MERTELIQLLAERIAAVKREHPVRVAIDGVDASGKTILADELVEPIQALGRPVIRASIDGFHNPRDIRYRLGRNSPQGYYDDSFDHAAIISHLLAPLGPKGNLEYRTECFDFRTDAYVDRPKQSADPKAILLFDGVFLHRPELARHWDLTVYVQADFEVTIERACSRDISLFGESEKVRAMYQERYIPGQQLYLEAVQPSERADVIVVNNDIFSPRLAIDGVELG